MKTKASNKQEPRMKKIGTPCPPLNTTKRWFALGEGSGDWFLNVEFSVFPCNWVRM